MLECPRCHTPYEEKPAFCGVCGTQIPGEVPMIGPPADPLIGMVLDGRYRIIDLIGRGGMGAVYRVEHVKMGKIMAVKILHGELSSNQALASRFKREAETVSRLTHSNTVSVFDFGSFGGMTYLVMEWIDGKDLAEQLSIDGPLDFIRASRILVQVCSSLKEAHSKGIVHRDLKPENILVCRQDDQDDFVKVLDFGLAKLRDSYKTKITAQGSLVGTPYYMAPEHIRAEAVDQRSDVYALGAVMHKLITGEPPFKANTPMGICTKHLTEAPLPPSKTFPDLKIPPFADRIVLKAMSKEPADRYQSADEMRCALADAIEEMHPGSDFRRFSSSEVPAPPPKAASKTPSSGPPRASWRLGNRPAPKTGGWSSGNQVTTQVAADQKPAPLPAPNAVIQTGSTSKSTTIGSREVAISTRSDFIEFEQHLKRRRVRTLVALVALITLTIVGASYFVLQTNWERPSPTAETEPNNTPQGADPLTRGVQLTGTIDGQEPNGDFDWYLLNGLASGRWAVSAQVTGVGDLDIALQLVDPNQDEPLAVANNTGAGGAESIEPFVVTKPQVYLLVREVRAPGAPVGNAPNHPYGVVYQVYDAAGMELEPNNEWASACPLAIGSALRGSLDRTDRTDWFEVSSDTPVNTVQVSSSPGADIDLTLRLSTDGRELLVDNLGPGQGEGVQIPHGSGRIRIAVGLKGNTTDGSPCSYQILVR